MTLPGIRVLSDIAYRGAERFFATLECELIDRNSFETHAEARMATFEFIEAWHNPHRRHKALGQKSPISFERSYQQGALIPSDKPSIESGELQSVI